MLVRILSSIFILCSASTITQAFESTQADVAGMMRTGPGTLAPTFVAVQSVSGTLKVTLSGKIESNFPPNAQINCTVFAEIFYGTGFFIPIKFERASVVATIDGITLSCTVYIPYLVHVDPSTAPNLFTSYQIVAFVPSATHPPTDSYNNSAATGSVVAAIASPIAASDALRVTGDEIQIIPLPATGKLTAQAVTDIIF